MPKKWPKGSIPDDNVERLKLAVTRARIVPLSAEERRCRHVVKCCQCYNMTT